MPFEEFAQLVETHKQEIAERAARALTLMRLPIYTGMSVAHIAQIYLPSLEVFAEYIRSNDLDSYRQYIQRVTAEQQQQSFSMQEILATGDTLAAKIREMLERKLPGPANETKRLSFNRRLDRLITIGQMTGVKNSIKE